MSERSRKLNTCAGRLLARRIPRAIRRPRPSQQGEPPSFRRLLDASIDTQGVAYVFPCNHYFHEKPISSCDLPLTDQAFRLYANQNFRRLSLTLQGIWPLCALQAI